jgi:dephospho-CoA kinase
MLTLKKVAITGGLASGKTSVCRIFKDSGAYVVNADEIVHRLLSPNTTVGQRVINLLGPSIITNGQLDRKKISEQIFSQPDKVKALELIIHPAVLDEIEKTYRAISKNEDYSLFVAEIPLLYESESSAQYHYDAVITILSDPALCRERFMKKTGYSEEEYDRRMQFQMSQEEKAAKADYVLVNNGNLAELKNQVNLILKELCLQ